MNETAAFREKIIDPFVKLFVFSDGNIKISRYVMDDSHHDIKFSYQNINSNGYYYVRVKVGNNYKKYFSHRLVAEAFIPNPENKTDINHKNGLKSDNRLENLEWCTHQENMQHAFNIGLNNQKGETHIGAKLNFKSANHVRRLSKFYNSAELSRIFEVSYTTIRKVLKNKIWINNEHI